MADKKNLCAQIDTALHMRVRQEQERSGRTLSEFVEQLITDYYKMKEGTKMTGDMRTMAIQLPEELFERLKAYLKKNNLKQKQFIIGLIEDALEQDETQPDGVQITPLTRELRLENVRFSYDGETEILRGVSAVFEAGKAYAVVGASGSGKSTLLNLLTSPGMAYEGSILLDGTELRTASPESLYETVSLIQQNVFVFNASIRDNITMFRSFPSEELAQAVRRAQLESLLADRGEGYLCGENGSGLSGGEKQRISIARSLLKHASVLLADEATAALDAQTAHQVTDDILSLTGVTRIVVTHTLEQAALRRYDGILVLKDGRIAESGSFDELMEQKGYFYALYTVSQ